LGISGASTLLQRSGEATASVVVLLYRQIPTASAAAVALLVFTGNQPALATLADIGLATAALNDLILATTTLTDVALASATIADDYRN